MHAILTYSVDNDQKVFKASELKLANKNLRISACTVAGRKRSDTPQKPNEDSFSILMVKDTLVAAVFDGTSSLKPIASLKEQTGARFASHYLKSVIENKEVGTTTKEIIRQLNTELLTRTLQFKEASLKDTYTLPASTATIIQIDPTNEKIYISHVGDSYCILFYRNGKSEFVTIDRNRKYDNKMLDLMKKVANEKNISPREARQDERIKQALLDMFQDSHNRADGTGQGLINGDTNAEQYIQDTTFPLEIVKAILLGTDGLIPPGYDEQNFRERQKILNLLKKGGLRELVRVKIDTENNDPDWNLLRYKHSDDATGIFIEL